jgi:predicted membrane channel-forming protein YqfA (hemolysin III family)
MSSHHQQQQRAVSSGGLVSIRDVPPWLRFNRYILTGYRPSPCAAWRCVRSALEWHNETINAWTHLIPAVSFVIMAVILVLSPQRVPGVHPPASGDTVVVVSAEGDVLSPLRSWWGDAAWSWPVIGLSLLSMAFIFSSSTTYHLGMSCCRSEEGYQSLLCLDVTASLVSMGTTAYSFILLGDRCADFNAVLGLAVGFGLFSALMLVIIVLVPMKAARRFVLFGIYCVTRLILSFMIYFRRFARHTHDVEASNGWLGIASDRGVSDAFILHATSFVVIFLGGLINVSRVPERFMLLSKRRWIDYIGNSHNLWHLTCVASALLTLMGCHADVWEYNATRCPHLH